jgi:hypothetical protein
MLVFCTGMARTDDLEIKYRSKTGKTLDNLAFRILRGQFDQLRVSVLGADKYMPIVQIYQRIGG